MMTDFATVSTRYAKVSVSPDDCKIPRFCRAEDIRMNGFERNDFEMNGFRINISDFYISSAKKEEVNIIF